MRYRDMDLEFLNKLGQNKFIKYTKVRVLYGRRKKI